MSKISISLDFNKKYDIDIIKSYILSNKNQYLTNTILNFYPDLKSSFIDIGLQEKSELIEKYFNNLYDKNFDQIIYIYIYIYIYILIAKK